jgi:hypothetical protein
MFHFIPFYSTVIPSIFIPCYSKFIPPLFQHGIKCEQLALFHGINWLVDRNKRKVLFHLHSTFIPWLYSTFIPSLFHVIIHGIKWNKGGPKKVTGMSWGLTTELNSPRTNPSQVFFCFLAHIFPHLYSIFIPPLFLWPWNKGGIKPIWLWREKPVKWARHVPHGPRNHAGGVTVGHNAGNWPQMHGMMISKNME